MNTPLPRPARHLPASEFQARLKSLLTWQARVRLDAILLFNATTNAYLTGLDTSNGLLLLHAEHPVFMTDFRYLAMAQRQANWLPCRTLWPRVEEQAALAKRGKTWRRVGYEGSLSTARFLALQAALPAVEWVDISATLAAFRSVKSIAEQAVVRAAITANDQLFAALKNQINPGMSECEIRTIARYEADRLGQGEAFDTIIGIGKNSAECHHHSDTTILRTGQPLLIDVGLKLNHYCADMTRMLFFGTPSVRYRELFKLVHQANRRAIRAIRPGRPCHEIDAVARQVIEHAGYGTYFGHGLGHGLGLEVHEAPAFSKTCQTLLKPGMILTVEPGIYLPNQFGIRIEDVIRITRTGCEVLTQTPH